MIKPRLLLPLVALVVGGAAVWVQRSRLAEPPPDVRIVAPGRPEIALPLPPFSLLDQEGRPFGLDDLAGKVWVATFVFTHCPAICPRTMERTKVLLAATGDLPLRVVTISVDPENDDPAAMKAYGVRFGADFDRWTLLSGDQRQIEETVLRGFKVALGRDDAGAIVHAERFVLVDGRGRIRGYFEADETGQRDLIDAARRLLAP